MAEQWRGIEHIQGQKKFVRVCRPHRREVTEDGHQSKLRCVAGCRIVIPSGARDGIDADEAPFDVVEESQVGRVSRPGGDMRGVKGSGPGGRVEKVMRREAFYSEHKHRLTLSLERGKHVPFVVRVTHKTHDGPTRKGELGAGRDEDSMVRIFEQQVEAAVKKGWLAGVPPREGALTEIPDPDEAVDAVRERRGGRKKAA